MPNVTASGLKIEQLRLLANDAQQTHRQLEAVLCSLAGSDEEAQWASEALENCGAAPLETVPAVASFVQHADELVASWACKLLARQGTGAQSAQAQLVAALTQDSRELVREEAARALGQVGNHTEAARAALMTAAAQGSPRLKRLATASLGG